MLFIKLKLFYLLGDNFAFLSVYYLKMISNNNIIVYRLLLHFLSQVGVPDLLQGVLGGLRCLGNVVPESGLHHLHVALGRLLPQDVGVANCGRNVTSAS